MKINANLSLPTAINILERLCIEYALSQYGGVVSDAAKFLDVRRSTLHEKIRRLGISANDYRRKSYACPVDQAAIT